MVLHAGDEILQVGLRVRAVDVIVDAAEVPPQPLVRLHQMHRETLLCQGEGSV